MKRLACSSVFSSLIRLTSEVYCTFYFLFQIFGHQWASVGSNIIVTLDFGREWPKIWQYLLLMTEKILWYFMIMKEIWSLLKYFVFRHCLHGLCPKSPLLFNLYIDYVIRIFVEKYDNENVGFYEHSYRINPRAISRDERMEMRRKNVPMYGTKSIPWNGYADDLILFLLTSLDLQKATELLDIIFTNFRLKINAQKSESMVFNHL